MAYFTKVNGGAGNVGEFIAFIGKQPRAVALQVKTGAAAAVDLRTQNGPTGAIVDIYKALSAAASILAIQIENTNGGQISVLLDGAAGYPDAAALQTAVRALGNIGSTPVDVSGTVVTDVGFKLALS